METEQVDSRTAMELAWDAAQENVDEPEGEVLESPEQSAESAGGEPAAEPEGEPEGELSGVRGEDEQAQAAESSASEGAPLDTPPKGLSLEAREAWKDTPDAVRKEIAKREADFERGIVKYAQNAKRAEAMDQALAPFQQYMAMNGGPQQAIGTLLQTGALLQMGNPTQKAQLVANMINQFGVDIKTLDSLLVGEQPKAGPEAQIEQLLEQRLAPLQQQLQTYQQREQQMQQQSQQKVMTELEQFAASNEFYDDVKMEMADLLDMAANRGRPMTLQEAYDIACTTHPQVNRVKQARQQQSTAQEKRRAASSVRGTPGSDGAGMQGGSIRDVLAEAWDNAGRM
jgi:hypothetical protein